MSLLFAAPDGTVEVRGAADRALSLRGRFPYNSTATLSDGGRRGRPRKERFASHAFQYSVDAKVDIRLLIGHDWSKPIASRATQSLSLDDSADALTFEANINPEVADTSHFKDAMALLAAGLAVGISPGFRIPPERTVKDAETVEEEDPAEGKALIRTVHEAILFELSLVTNPAYHESQVEARAWSVGWHRRNLAALERVTMAYR